MLDKIKEKIKVYKNAFSIAEKDRLFNGLVPHLRVISENHPGLQTGPYGDGILPIKFKYFKYDQVWMNYTNNIEYEAWHTHEPYERVAVYYFHDCPGTVFRGKFGRFQLEGIANSIITFPGDLEHTAPSFAGMERHTLAFNLLEEFSI